MSEDKLNIPVDGVGDLQVSVQTYQAMHKLITGRSDSLTQYYDDPFEIDLEELVQLDKKIEQVCSNLSVLSKNKVINIAHKDDCNSELASFDLYDRDLNSPTESVHIKYNYLLSPVNVDPSIKKPQKFTISIKFNSQLLIVENLMKLHEKLPLPIKLFQIFSAKINIEYEEYISAKTTLHMIDECIKGFKTQRVNKLLQYMINYPNYLALFFKYIFLLTFLTLLILYSPLFLATFHNQVLGLSKIILWGFAILFFSYRVGCYLGQKTKLTLSNLERLSTINLNKGDKKILNESKRNNKNTLWKLFGEVAFTVVTSVIVSYITDHFFK